MLHNRSLAVRIAKRNGLSVLDAQTLINGLNDKQIERLIVESRKAESTRKVTIYPMRRLY